MNLIVRGLSNKEIASVLNLAEGLTAKECLQSAEVCLALAHKTKELGTRAALLGFAYEFRAVAKRLERDEAQVDGASRLRRYAKTWRIIAHYEDQKNNLNHGPARRSARLTVLRD